MGDQVLSNVLHPCKFLKLDWKLEESFSDVCAFTRRSFGRRQNCEIHLAVCEVGARAYLLPLLSVTSIVEFGSIRIPSMSQSDLYEPYDPEHPYLLLPDSVSRRPSRRTNHTMIVNDDGQHHEPRAGSTSQELSSKRQPNRPTETADNEIDGQSGRAVKITRFLLMEDQKEIARLELSCARLQAENVQLREENEFLRDAIKFSKQTETERLWEEIGRLKALNGNASQKPTHGHNLAPKLEKVM